MGSSQTCTKSRESASRCLGEIGNDLTGRPGQIDVSNSALGLLYGHGILTIYENLLL